jgi:hypothetical protein
MMIASTTTRPCVILESPYAGDVKRNVGYARKCLRDSVLRGEAPIASHLLYTQPGVLDDDDIIERTLGIACGLAWLPRSSYSVFYTDRGWSNGMLAALHDHNLKHNHPFRIRSLSGEPVLPATLDEDIETLLRNYIER